MPFATYLPMLLLAFQIPGLPLDDADRFGYLTLKVVDQYGQEVSDAVITVRPQTPSPTGPSKIPGWKNGDSLVYGTYSVVVEAPAHFRAIETVKIQQKVSYLGLCARFDLFEGEHTITISLRPTSTPCTTARMLPVFDTANKISQDLFVIANRKLVLMNIPSGDYVLVRFDGKRTCGISPLRVTNHEHQEVELN